MGKYTWDLSSIFSSAKEFDREIKLIQSRLKKKPFKVFDNNLTSSTLKKFLDLFFQLKLQIEKCHTYAHLKLDCDLKSETWNKHNLQVQNLENMLQD